MSMLTDQGSVVTRGDCGWLLPRGDNRLSRRSRESEQPRRRPETPKGQHDGLRESRSKLVPESRSPLTSMTDPTSQPPPTRANPTALAKPLAQDSTQVSFTTAKPWETVVRIRVQVTVRCDSVPGR